jgi:hypothetical protein
LPPEKLSARATVCVFSHFSTTPVVSPEADAPTVPHTPTAMTMASSALIIRFFTVFHLLSYTAAPRFMLTPPGRGRLSGFSLTAFQIVPSYTKTFQKGQNPTRAKKYFFVFEKTLKSQGLFFYRLRDRHQCVRGNL